MIGEALSLHALPCMGFARIASRLLQSAEWPDGGLVPNYPVVEPQASKFGRLFTEERNRETAGNCFWTLPLPEDHAHFVDLTIIRERNARHAL